MCCVRRSPIMTWWCHCFHKQVMALFERVPSLVCSTFALRHSNLGFIFAGADNAGSPVPRRSCREETKIKDKVEKRTWNLKDANSWATEVPITWKGSGQCKHKAGFTPQTPQTVQTKIVQCSWGQSLEIPSCVHFWACCSAQSSGSWLTKPFLRTVGAD